MRSIRHYLLDFIKVYCRIQIHLFLINTNFFLNKIPNEEILNFITHCSVIQPVCLFCGYEIIMKLNLKERKFVDWANLRSEKWKRREGGGGGGREEGNGNNDNGWKE